MFTIYCSVTSVSLIVHNSFGNSMTTEASSLRTIELTNTSSTVNSFLAIRSSFSLNVTWDSLQSSSVCGTFTGYSVYVDSMQVNDLYVPGSAATMLISRAAPIPGICIDIRPIPAYLMVSKSVKYVILVLILLFLHYYP